MERWGDKNIYGEMKSFMDALRGLSHPHLLKLSSNLKNLISYHKRMVKKRNLCENLLYFIIFESEKFQTLF